jgi:hypothetical protein
MTDNEQSGAALSRRDEKAASRDALALAALAAALAVSGCAGPPFSPDSDLTCNSAQQCRVEVAVACMQGACTLSVDHPRVFARGHAIVWSIVNKPGQSYKFADDGDIAFKTQAGRDVFRCHVEANGARIACTNGGTAGTFEYGVRVSGSPPVPPLDPWVVNH